MVPVLPEDNVDLESPLKLELLVPGLEESRGALYEIGVSDDGTLVGLTKDEMKESIATLRVMAASLGCTVEVVRTVIVGDCEWEEATKLPSNGHALPSTNTRKGKLWVTEALVTPHLGIYDRTPTNVNGQLTQVVKNDDQPVALPSRGSSATPQLRITLTGPTTSGKSSLLGTLSTGTLDNGRGKSRLSLLKHRHEMVSGITSSIAQELIGYNGKSIINFAQGNVESWIDIHDCSENGRLVFLSDSGGHPRYRRTVLRGLMSWAPHWSILCIAADAADGSATAPGEVTSAVSRDVDFVGAHLSLSLKLDVPMAVVITKLDLASKQSLQKTMVKILAAIKEAKRTPKIVQPDQVQHDIIHDIPSEDNAKAENLVKDILESDNLSSHVPIVLTSAVRGTGIGTVHALLACLPLPHKPTAQDYVGLALNPEQPKCLFHIDDTFELPISYCALARDSSQQKADQGVIVSGNVRFGGFSVGDRIVLGPFQPEDEESQSLQLADDGRPSPGNFGLSISHPSSAQLARIAMTNAVSAANTPGEWHRAQVVSVRNLRLPVRTLEAGQVGSVGLVFEGSGDWEAKARVRRGMVLAIPSKHMLDTRLSLQAASGFVALFREPSAATLTAGCFVNVYVASVKATARVLSVARHTSDDSAGGLDDDIDDIFSLSAETGDATPATKDFEDNVSVEVSLELLHNREWIEMGSKVMILEGGSQDRTGLEGFVGKVIEIVE